MAVVLTRLRVWTPAQIVALAFGLWWIGNALAVFLAVNPSSAGLDSDGTVRALGVSIAVNGWHGVFHLATGLAGLATCWWDRSARGYLLAMGVLYTLAALSSLVTGVTVFGLIRVDELGSADHAFEGVVLMIAWFASVGGSEGLAG